MRMRHKHTAYLNQREHQGAAGLFLRGVRLLRGAGGERTASTGAPRGYAGGSEVRGREKYSQQHGMGGTDALCANKQPLKQ